MKTLLICLTLVFSLASCGEQVIEVQPVKDQFKGTQWSSYVTDSPSGKPVYKVLRFQSPDLVEIDFRVDKIYLYTAGWEYTYLTQENKIWVKNPDNTISSGEIVDNKFLFGGEVFTRDK